MTKNEPTPGKKLTQKKVATISCKATSGCDGRQATIIRAQNTPGGGRSILYRCQTCKGMFGLNY